MNTRRVLDALSLRWPVRQDLTEMGVNHDRI